ncbi:COPZ1 protein, partial [Dasyornis broadbenti]|nr:COPZ1 protein [Dasyornis broadbenti]
LQEPSLYTVKAIIILDNDGERLFAKYYDDTYPSVKEQRAFEKNIFSKTHRSDSSNVLGVSLGSVPMSGDVPGLCPHALGLSLRGCPHVLGLSPCLRVSLECVPMSWGYPCGALPVSRALSPSQSHRKNVERRALLDNMEGLFLAVDEIVDGGVILESDPQQVVHRVAVR